MQVLSAAQVGAQATAPSLASPAGASLGSPFVPSVASPLAASAWPLLRASLASDGAGDLLLLPHAASNVATSAIPSVDFSWSPPRES